MTGRTDQTAPSKWGADSAAAWAALTEAARDFESPEGTVRFDNAAYCVSARA